MSSPQAAINFLNFRQGLPRSPIFTFKRRLFMPAGALSCEHCARRGRLREHWSANLSQGGRAQGHSRGNGSAQQGSPCAVHCGVDHPILHPPLPCDGPRHAEQLSWKSAM